MSVAKHILVVEDDTSLAEWISDYLLDHGYGVTVASQGDFALEMIADEMPDLVLLDVMMPVKNGFDVCKEARAFYTGPILFMTACVEDGDEIRGLDAGADDYLTKPIRPQVLLARIKALLRRVSDEEQKQQLVFDSLVLNATAKSVTIDKQPLDLNANEFDVLWLLALKAGTIVSRNELVAQLRGIEYDGLDRSVDIRISRLRKKLQEALSQPYKVKTIRGKGYLFCRDEAEQAL
ncbi:response regulator transcription factor [Shewanella sp. NKUCC05_KAH]|jgi:DNA-binding response OmpR family regulator|uniref:Response regulator transcription factor n=1 Tax=Shewanella oncorhynchi TaxID=2726434 RepID=A0AA50Q5Y8_9GAMM|nr:MULTISPECIES: response regulator transcription factor [Shewanella]GCF89453.1 DNA-binding response regulator [Shewanella sp. M-Br]AVI65026.1 DNA-binding response regulator [Shewanella sp. WE21]MBI1674910.1 response regulator transcription factor [Shewanella sp. DW31]MBP7663924.1 response regulator transcription factor [Shewanella sp.]MBW3515147.1 response regulator transcription factor [Shewanella sp. NKUCC01_JLK]